MWNPGIFVYKDKYQAEVRKIVQQLGDLIRLIFSENTYTQF